MYIWSQTAFRLPALLRNRIALQHLVDDERELAAAYLRLLDPVHCYVGY